MKLRHVGMLAAAVAGLAFAASGVKAETIQSFQTGSSFDGISTYTYNFKLELTPNNGLTSVSPFTSALVIIDFPGLTGASLNVAGGDLTGLGDWTVSTPLDLGALGSVLVNAESKIDLNDNLFKTFVYGNNTGSEVDSQNVFDIVLAYTGAGVPVNLTGSNIPLIHMAVTSTYAISPVIELQSLSRNTTALTSAQVDSFPVSVAVPLPAAAWMGLSTLAGIIGLRAARRRRPA